MAPTYSVNSAKRVDVRVVDRLVVHPEGIVGIDDLVSADQVDRDLDPPICRQRIARLGCQDQLAAQGDLELRRRLGRGRDLQDDQPAVRVRAGGRVGDRLRRSARQPAAHQAEMGLDVRLDPQVQDAVEGGARARMPERRVDHRLRSSWSGPGSGLGSAAGGCPHAVSTSWSGSPGAASIRPDRTSSRFRTGAEADSASWRRA